jgi:hypothetical protein
MSSAAPFVEVLEATDPGVTIAATDSFTIGQAPFGGTVTAISYTPEAASTGDNTNRRTYTVVNKGQAGVGTTVVGTLDLITGVNLVAFDEKPFTLSVVGGATTVVEGDTLALVSTAVASGLVDPGGIVKVTISRVAGA